MPRVAAKKMPYHTSLSKLLVPVLFVASASASAAVYQFDFGTQTSNVQPEWTRVTTNSTDPNGGTQLSGSPYISATIPTGKTIVYRDRGKTSSFGDDLDHLELLRDLISVNEIGSAPNNTVTFTISGLAANTSYTVSGYAVDMFNSTTNNNITVTWATNGGSVDHTTRSGNPDLASARFQMETMTSDASGVATITASVTSRHGNNFIVLNGLEVIDRIPEPSTALLVGLGLLALLHGRRR